MSYAASCRDAGTRVVVRRQLKCRRHPGRRTPPVAQAPSPGSASSPRWSVERQLAGDDVPLWGLAGEDMRPSGLAGDDIRAG
ncbi:hypothetical protein [Nocardioides terrigena]|uniref:hypothetical protein n=1 Tax=Nocardioides terrigena TaxID=424797 RepID=UPI00131F35E5|nr:hypothetical protein [Nocardioides terrigena]